MLSTSEKLEGSHTKSIAQPQPPNTNDVLLPTRPEEYAVYFLHVGRATCGLEDLWVVDDEQNLIMR